MTDHNASVYLYKLQDTSNMLTRWAISLQNFDFTVEYVADKLDVVSGSLSRLFGERPVNEVTHEPVLAAICRNVADVPNFHPAGPRAFEVSAQMLQDIDIVRDDKALVASAISLFP